MPEVIINGPAGRIEGRYHQNPDPKAPVALVLHPNPTHGGTMNNKVTYNMYKNFVDNGFSVLRFNFRGVGRSQGEFDKGIGELQDATVALNWLHNQNMDSKTFWVGGFSFGSWIGLQLIMRRPDIEYYILAAPPASKYDFNFIVPCPASGLIVQGDEDDISLEADSAELAEKLSARNEAEIQYELMLGSDHFFRKDIDQFNNICDDYIKDKLIIDSKKVIKVKRDRRRRRKKKNGVIPRSERYISPIKPLSAF
ncbi:alpha/beta hydrolase [Rickettsiales bacterium]|nr:alpha/beta hydrolase [Rickettsiales bacterium]